MIIAGKIYFNPNWIELMLNLNFQGFRKEFWSEISDTHENVLETMFKEFNRIKRGYEK